MKTLDDQNCLMSTQLWMTSFQNCRDKMYEDLQIKSTRLVRTLRIPECQSCRGLKMIQASPHIMQMAGKELGFKPETWLQ